MLILDSFIFQQILLCQKQETRNVEGPGRAEPQQAFFMSHVYLAKHRKLLSFSGNTSKDLCTKDYIEPLFEVESLKGEM